jgi:hypothetical protein
MTIAVSTALHAPDMLLRPLLHEPTGTRASLPVSALTSLAAKLLRIATFPHSLPIEYALFVLTNF